MLILAIESSCDETAAAVLEGQGEKLKVLSNVVSSQIEIHKKYGGVVPEVAAREHVLNIIPVVNEALLKAGLTPPFFPPLTKGRANNPSPLIRGRLGGGLAAIAVTAGPGLITSLIIGVESAKALAYAWKLPLISVNHIEGHIYSNWLNQTTNNKQQITNIKFPAVILTVSGGHNLLVLMTGHLKYKIIGDTRDDAAGEAFDKGAKLLGLGYPGGPAIAMAAEKVSSFKFQVSGDRVASRQIILPRPMMNSGDLDFSFSGLKTALLYQLRDDPSASSGRGKNWKKKIPAYAAEYQQAIIDVLIAKTIKAAKQYHPKTIMLAGGVSANTELRQQFAQAVAKHCPTSAIRYPLSDYTTDNATMIAAAGYFKFKAGQTVNPNKLRANPNWGL